MAILREQPRPRRRYVWRTPLTLVVLLAVLVGGAWWGWNSLTESTAEPQCVMTQLPNNKLLPKNVVVNVYNGGAKAGTAKTVAALLKNRGFLIGEVRNEPNGERVQQLAVRGNSNTAAEVRLVAGQVTQTPPIVQDGRTDHSVDLIVGAGFTKVKPGYLRYVAVPGGQSCIPVRQTPAPIPSGEVPN